MREDREARRDLRATSDSVREDAERLAKLEDDKEHMDPSDPRIDDLSAQIADLGRDVANKTQAELEISVEVAGDSPDARN